MMREEKSALVEICIQYDVAPLDLLQVSVGSIDTPVAPSEGEARIGEASMVVKDQTFDQTLVPPAFVAFTLQ